jgi:hypothetical protein
MTRALAAIAAALALSACAQAYSPMAHYDVPAACTAAALAKIKISVIEVEQIPYQLHQHYDTLGLWAQRPSGNVIMIRAGLSETEHAKVLAHERCHELIFQLTGSGHWHG